jgi:hypothetical protein
MAHSLTDWTIRVDVEAALRGQGVDPEAVRERSPAVLAAAARAVPQGQALLRPLVTYRRLSVERHEWGRLVLDSGALEFGAEAADCLASARELVVLACTIGSDLESMVDQLFPTDPVAALALDGVGNVAVEALAIDVCRHFTEEGKTRGLGGSTPCWPGGAGWPTAQALPQILDLLGPGGDDGQAVRLSPSMMLRPLKSVCLAVGLAPGAEARELACAACGHSPLAGWVRAAASRVS